MISTVKSPQPPFAKGGRPLWLAVSSCFPLLQRGMEGDFHSRGRQHFSVMTVYEAVKTEFFDFFVFSSFRRKPESSIFRELQKTWTPFFNGVTTFYETVNIDAFVNVHDTEMLSPARMKIPLHPPLQKGEAGGNGDPKRSPPFRKGGLGGFHG